MQFSRAILSGNFSMFESLKRGAACVLWLKKYISRKDSFCKI